MSTLRRKTSSSLFGKDRVKAVRDARLCSEDLTVKTTRSLSAEETEDSLQFPSTSQRTSKQVSLVSFELDTPCLEPNQKEIDKSDPTEAEIAATLQQVDVDSEVFTSLISSIHRLKPHWESESHSVMLRKMVSGGSWSLAEKDWGDSGSEQEQQHGGDLTSIKKFSALLRKYNDQYFIDAGMDLRHVNGRLYFTQTI